MYVYKKIQFLSIYKKNTTNISALKSFLVVC